MATLSDEWTPDMDMSGETKHPSDIAKDLFNSEKPFTSTEFSERRAILMTQCQFYAKKIHNLDLFLGLIDWANNMKSHDRKSREEFRDALTAMEALNKMQQFMPGQFGQGPGMRR